jgi:hypothetical protein
MVYVEQVGVKRQDGGNRGEIKYLYPFTHPINAFPGNRVIFISSALPTSESGCSFSYSSANITRMLTGEIWTHGKNNINTLWILFSFKPERFPDNSFNAVSLHCTTNFPMDAYTKPAVD